MPDDLLQESSPQGVSPRECFGIGCLRREQLVYELRIRGQSEEGGVQELATRLRSVLDSPLQVTRDVIGEVGSAIQTCTVTIAGIRGNLELLEASRPTRHQLYRVQAQVCHIHNRIKDLKSLKPSNAQAALLDKLLEQVSEVQFRLGVLGWAEPGASDTSEPFASGASGGLGELGVGTLTDLTGKDSFAKLPNPIMQLFQGVTRFSIEDLENIVRVLWFTVRCQRHAEALAVREILILQLMYPLTTGTLARYLEGLLRGQGTLGELRRVIVNDKLTPRMRRELENRYFWRAQGSGETLTEYIDEIRTANIALELKVTEREVVGNILEGMRPEDRSRVMFANRPSTFIELEQLVTSIEGISFVDQRRGGQTAVCSVAGQRVESRKKEAARENERGPCFGCGRQGHLVRECPVRKKAPSGR